MKETNHQLFTSATLALFGRDYQWGLHALPFPILISNTSCVYSLRVGPPFLALTLVLRNICDLSRIVRAVDHLSRDEDHVPSASCSLEFSDDGSGLRDPDSYQSFSV